MTGWIFDKIFKAVFNEQYPSKALFENVIETVIITEQYIIPIVNKKTYFFNLFKSGQTSQGLNTVVNHLHFTVDLHFTVV